MKFWNFSIPSCISSNFVQKSYGIKTLVTYMFPCISSVIWNVYSIKTNGYQRISPAVWKILNTASISWIFVISNYFPSISSVTCNNFIRRIFWRFSVIPTNGEPIIFIIKINTKNSRCWFSLNNRRIDYFPTFSFIIRKIYYTIDSYTCQPNFIVNYRNICITSSKKTLVSQRFIK